MAFKDSQGYLRVRTNRTMHKEVAENVLGKPLPKGAVVHHVNEDKTDNRPENLAILQNQSEHMLLHAKKRVVDAGGCWETHALCGKCKQLKHKQEFPKLARAWNGVFDRCKECNNAARRGKRYSSRLRARKRQEGIA